MPVTPDMRFRIGSVTKQFTAAAVLLLGEEGLPLSATRFFQRHGFDRIGFAPDRGLLTLERPDGGIIEAVRVPEPHA